MGTPIGGVRGSSDSSSGEEDGDAEWKAAINSVVTNGDFTPISNGSTPNIKEDQQKTQNVKHYQIKAQKLLEDILDKTLVTVREPINVPDNDTDYNEGGGIRLFKNAPLGIVVDHNELQGPKKKPRILPGETIEEKSKKFRQQLESVAVDGNDILAAARDACQKSLARLEAKDAAARAAAKKEEERVAELKRIRGERWLPSIAREMQVKSRR